MTKIEGSFAQIASSVAASIAESSSRTTSPVGAATPIRESLKAAFEGLMKSSAQSGQAEPGLAPMEPFTPPSIPSDALMTRLTEALQSFQEINGGMQSIGAQQSPGSMQTISQAQHTAQLGTAQLVGNQQFGAGSAQRVSDQQLAATPGNMQLGSDKQLVSDQQLGASSGQMQHVSDQQLANPGNMQLGADQQFAGRLGNMPRVADQQFAGNLSDKQIGSDKQLVSDQQSEAKVGNMQLVSDQQRRGAGNAQLSADVGHAEQTSDGPGLSMLNDCNRLFALLHRVVSAEKELKLGPSHTIR